MGKISVQGAIDMHIHSHPCLFERIADDREIACAARDAGIAAIMFKCHHESTVSRAYLLQREIDGIKIFGGVVLNSYVGGINPAAAEAALKLGGKEVWMPTIDADYHAKLHGGTGSYDVQSGGRKGGTKGISILKKGKIIQECHDVLDLVAQYNAILGTCHLSPKEIRLLVDAAKEHKINKILLTHPYFKVPGVDLDFVKEMVGKGAMAEFGFCTVSPMWAYARMDKYVESIRAIGAENCILISDGGQRHNPMPHEGLRIFAQCLYEKGISEAELEKMISINQRRLLDI